MNFQLYTYLPRVATDVASTHGHTLEQSQGPLKVTDVPLDQRLPNGRSMVVPRITWNTGSAVTRGISDTKCNSEDGVAGSRFLRRGHRQWSGNCQFIPRFRSPGGFKNGRVTDRDQRSG